MSASYTATTFIDADPERVFEYVRVPENQPSWAINFVRSTRPLSDGRYAMQTPAGELIYRIKEDPRCRTVDFVYETPEGQKTMILPTRVVAHGSWSVLYVHSPSAAWHERCRLETRKARAQRGARGAKETA
jgi:uncharacterized protein YndB with AHSA1/START domain